MFNHIIFEKYPTRNSKYFRNRALLLLCDIKETNHVCKGFTSKHLLCSKIVVVCKRCIRFWRTWDSNNIYGKAEIKCWCLFYKTKPGTKTPLESSRELKKCRCIMRRELHLEFPFPSYSSLIINVSTRLNGRVKLSWDFRIGVIIKL